MIYIKSFAASREFYDTVIINLVRAASAAWTEGKGKPDPVITPDAIHVLFIICLDRQTWSKSAAILFLWLQWQTGVYFLGFTVIIEVA